ncbi:outer membrane beta-barrel protein [Patescibacteria group bacterium]|nr:outer membrane beta-barrel protein [Patescibacteria group bacterium]
MKRIIVLVFALFMVVCFAVPISLAEERAEEDFGRVTIFAGPEYMFFGSLKVDDKSDINIDGKLGLNVGMGVKITDSIGIEASWSGFRLDESDLDLLAENQEVADVDVDYISLGPVFSYKIAEKITLNAGLGGYLCLVDIKVSDPESTESDSGGAWGGYVKVGASIPVVSKIVLGISGGYRYGGDIEMFTNRDWETSGGFCTALIKINF